MRSHAHKHTFSRYHSQRLRLPEFGKEFSFISKPEIKRVFWENQQGTAMLDALMDPGVNGNTAGVTQTTARVIKTTLGGNRDYS